MIDIVDAQETFKSYLKQYNENDDKIALKIKHTYNVLNVCEYISREAGLDEENINIAKLIALLHDIGRFEQVKRFDSYSEENIDHAEYGLKVLFEENMIRDFIKEDKYDNIIYKAIKNHNKYKIEEGLTEQELLHSKIIRDSDKIDNYRVKETESFEALFGISEEQFSEEKLSEKIYNDFLSGKLIDIKEPENCIDCWVLYIAFLFDFNFPFSFKYIKEKNCINKIIDRVKYKDYDTNLKMQNIKEFANNYIKSKVQ